MSDIVWGDAIEVNGKRPEWLHNSDWNKVAALCFDGENQLPDSETNEDMDDWVWTDLKSIRLPADHFANLAIAKGFTPWGGGSEAPKDWDEGRILYRDGGEGPPSISWWTHDGGSKGGEPCNSDIIGYHPKPIAQPSPADTVTVRVMSEGEVRALWHRSRQPHHLATDTAVAMMVNLGLIRPATKAERIAKSTNLPLADVERVLAAFEEGE